MKNFLNKLAQVFIIAALLISLRAQATMEIIYDAEMQNAINQIAAPIFKAARLKKPEIYIIANPHPNAFTAGGEIIYINSGLITQFPEPNILRGVIAHEVGHISSKHVSISENITSDQQKFTTTSLILGILGSAITKDPNFVIHGAIIGAHAAERLLLKHSRANETSADIKALEYLSSTGHSSDGLITLLEYFEQQNKIPVESRYDLTHPISRERISLIKNKISTHNTHADSPQIIEKYQMAAAKLSAYTTNSINKKKFSPNAILYAESVIAMKKIDKETSIKKIDYLLAQDQKNPYLHQLKAEIFAFFRDAKALDEFRKAVSLSNDPLIAIEFAVAKIQLSRDKALIKEAIITLEAAPNKLLENTTILNYLSFAHSLNKNEAYSIYYRSLAQKNIGNLKLAKKLAYQAKTLASNNQALILKCDDIMYDEE